MLNEMFPPPKAPQYKVTSQTGPPNNPTFTMVCTIEDRNFPGKHSNVLLKPCCSHLFFSDELVVNHELITAVAYWKYWFFGKD